MNRFSQAEGEYLYSTSKCVPPASNTTDFFTRPPKQIHSSAWIFPYAMPPRSTADPLRNLDIFDKNPAKHSLRRPGFESKIEQQQQQPLPSSNRSSEGLFNPLTLKTPKSIPSSKFDVRVPIREDPAITSSYD
ncbi:hypothetical protein K7432_013127 [Basidiobolus ranarum]|uniref:Uncharacterized protein n=1 Tax=Basidiobolus ranarum TaxID=34480 RepID=A0ABR2WJV9_9FUNG